jgi:hypothetical protein
MGLIAEMIARELYALGQKRKAAGAASHQIDLRQSREGHREAEFGAFAALA